MERRERHRQEEPGDGRSKPLPRARQQGGPERSRHLTVPLFRYDSRTSRPDAAAS